jgi:hypothetical protein
LFKTTNIAINQIQTTSTGQARMRRQVEDDIHVRLRINVRQGILDVRVCRDALLRLPTAVTYLSKPLIDADDSGYAACGTKHPNVPRTPVPHSNDADLDSLRSRPHIPPPAAAIPRPRSLRSFSLMSEASLIAGWNGTPA